MGIIWKPQPIEVYQAWIGAILDEASDSLTDWEINFIESISTRLNTGKNLTLNQAIKLESIYIRVT